MLNKYRRRKNIKLKGFTLIELLFVFAIISIIAMVSVPFYQNYSVRTKVSGDLLLANPLLKNMNLQYTLNRAWPSSNSDAGANEPTYYSGKYLMSAEISDEPQAGTMTLTYNADELPALRGTDTIVFYPDEGAATNSWKCDQGSIPAKYRPPNCR